MRLDPMMRVSPAAPKSKSEVVALAVVASFGPRALILSPVATAFTPFNLYAHCENGDFICYKFGENPTLIYKHNFNSLKYSSEFMIFTSNQKFVLSLGWAKSLALVDFW
jgi:hypothetical protein